MFQITLLLYHSIDIAIVFAVVKLDCTEREFALSRYIFVTKRECVITQLFSVVFFSFQCPTFYSCNWISDISGQDYS